MRSMCAPPAKLRIRLKNRTHASDPRSRLHVLEAALAKLFPAGDIAALAQDLLLSDDHINDVDMADYLTSGPPTKSALLGSPVLQTTDSPLLTVQEQTQFVENYFMQYQVLCPLLNEGCSRRDFHSPSLSPASQLLVQMVLTILAWLTPQPRDGLVSELFLQAKDQFQRIPITDHGDISVVQALVLLSDFALKQGTAGERSLPLSKVDQETRRRVWWSVYCTESYSAKIYGRPLLLPDDNLITDLAASDGLLAARTDKPTIYTDLTQQSSYHRMANRIYRRLLSRPMITQQDVEDADQTINTWHRDSSFCAESGDRSSQPEWHFTARRHHILCDQSLRLLIHRAMLLQWLRGCSGTIGPENHDSAGAAHCRAQGLEITRTIAMIADSLVTGRCPRLTLSFTLYAFFHALIVPHIHVKKDPCSSVSISCMQELARAQAALDYLPVEGDALSGYFVIFIRRSFMVASSRSVNSYADQGRQNDILGAQELALLEAGDLDPPCGLDFSEWVNL
ncbi:hypothetical protein BDW62DRAFT_216762 [Aspergillus aurantiobrunneus]